MKPRVLYVVHNHPEVRPGGVEVYAYELYEAMRDSGTFESLLLARTGPPLSKIDRYRADTPFTAVGADPNQYFFYTDPASYDGFLGSMRDKPLVTRHFREFLEGHHPDVIHFHHTVYLGYEFIRQIRNTLPDAAIVYTLNEFLPICHRLGLLVRTGSEEPCMEESPRRCHECFPDIDPGEFFLRKRFVMSHFDAVDLFLAPSEFLRQRYIDWGIEPERIRFEDLGRIPDEGQAPGTDERSERNRLAFFGQLNRYKGISVLLRAMAKLGEWGVDAWLSIHGANLDLQPDDFQAEFNALRAVANANVDYAGPYRRDELPALMAQVDWVVVPSTWWENSPLVIQEAFRHGRPVICSDIGGMAEKVTHGFNGLHFRAKDADNLAAVIAHAVGTPGLWDELRSGISGAHPMNAHLDALTAIYEELLARRRTEATSAA